MEDGFTWANAVVEVLNDDLCLGRGRKAQVATKASTKRESLVGSSCGSMGVVEMDGEVTGKKAGIENSFKLAGAIS
ncbi:MAG: hypothetical protein AAF089_02890 [Bacteroidota bacterium]